MAQRTQPLQDIQSLNQPRQPASTPQTLTSAQEQRILEARPDVGRHETYGSNVGAWWDKYGKKEMPDFFSITPEQQQTILDQRPDVARAVTGDSEWYGNVGGWWQNYGKDEMPNLFNSQDVYSQDNIQNATDSPSVRPDDLLGQRDLIREELGIPGIQEQYQKLYKDYLGTQSSRDNVLNELQNKTVGMNVIRGSQDVANRQYSQNLEAQARGLDVVQSQLQAAQMEAAERFGIKQSDIQEKKDLMLQHPEAGITWSDSMESIQKKVSKAQQQQESQQQIQDLMLQYPGAGIDMDDSFEDAIKKGAEEAAMGAMGYSFADRPKGMSKRQYKKKILKKKEDQEAYEDMVKELELEEMRLDMENTRSIMANRGSSEEEDLPQVKNDNDLRLIIRQLKREGTDWPTAKDLIADNYGYSTETGDTLDRMLHEVYDGEVPSWLMDEALAKGLLN